MWWLIDFLLSLPLWLLAFVLAAWLMGTRDRSSIAHGHSSARSHS